MNYHLGLMTQSPLFRLTLMTFNEIVYMLFGGGLFYLESSTSPGEYDATSINAELDELIQSAPCVMFTWENSPACKKAVQGFDSAGAKVKIVRLDNPWSEGNILRAELGKRVGRSSVPCIFIGNTYVGGFDDGVSDESPGIMKLAFEGKLRSMLDDAGAM